MIDWRQLAVALIRYDLDAPHAHEVNPYYPNLTWDAVQGWLENAHYGDCVGVDAVCLRCVAEHQVHRSKWVAENILPPCEPPQAKA